MSCRLALLRRLRLLTLNPRPTRYHLQPHVEPVRACSTNVADSAALKATGVHVQSIISIQNLSKTYPSGFQALKEVNLDIQAGEIFALLGPNGAGKTTLISIICGIVNASSGRVVADGFDIVTQYREARARIGLVPQELAVAMFETVWDTLKFSRGLSGKPMDKAYLEQLLRDLSLWDKRHNKIMTLSGGMKRRVLIAKALAHQPRILFLDEPTAGVDVELRRDMWQMIRGLRDNGVTVILTTHYIEEAEEMADRIGVINKGQLVLVEEKTALMKKLGKKQLTLQLQQPLSDIPPSLADFPLALGQNGEQLIYTYDEQNEKNRITELLRQLSALNVEFRDLNTSQSSLEDIFVSLVEEK
jgi:ABC-2 type transport system ATP-binding protein